MRAIERTPPPTALHQALDRLYATCQLPPPVVLAAREVDDFTRLVRLAGRPQGFAYWFAVVVYLTGYAVFVSLMAPGYPPTKSLATGIIFTGIAVLMTTFRPALFSFATCDPLPARLVSVAAGVAALGVAGVVGLATGSGIWAGAAAMWMAALSYALLLSMDAIGSPLQWLRLRMTWGAHLPLTGALPIRDQLRPRLASAIAAAIAQHGRAADSVPPAERVDRAITAAFDRVWSGHSPIDPLLGRGLRSWQREGVDEVTGLADPPLLVAAALAVDRNCLAVTFFDHVAVALTLPEPGPIALPPSRSEAAGRALDALLLPWPYPTLARRLPLRWGEKLAAWLIDRERDPILRFTAIERMGPQLLFDVLGRQPADRGPEGELYVAGAGVPTMLLRVVDLVPNEDGSERVHWIPVPPHMVKASEAVAWSFGQSPGGYRPSMQS